MGLIDDINRLQKQLGDKKQEAQRCEVTIKDYELRNEPDQVKAEEVKLGTIRDEIVKLETQLRDQQSKIDQAQQQIKGLENDLSNAQQQLATTRSREVAIVSEIDHMQREIRQLQSNLGGGGGFF